MRLSLAELALSLTKLSNIEKLPIIYLKLGNNCKFPIFMIMFFFNLLGDRTMPVVPAWSKYDPTKNLKLLSWFLG